MRGARGQKWTIIVVALAVVLGLPATARSENLKVEFTFDCDEDTATLPTPVVTSPGLAEICVDEVGCDYKKIKWKVRKKNLPSGYYVELTGATGYEAKCFPEQKITGNYKASGDVLAACKPPNYATTQWKYDVKVTNGNDVCAEADPGVIIRY